MNIFDEYIEINNSRQNIMVMSSCFEKPVLLIVHGGPGIPDRPLVRNYSSELAAYYTVVCWDQRGSGLSYSKEHLTVDMMLSDMEAVVVYLTKKYNQEKIYVAGHSWGSYLALQFVSKHPEYVKYYIGTGQEISVIKSEIDRYRFVREYAVKKNKKSVLRKLDRFGEPDGYSYKKDDKIAKLYVSKKINAYEGFFSKNGGGIAQYVPLYLKLYAACYGKNLGKVINGAVKSLSTIYREMDLKDSISGITELRVPVLLISGEEDMICPVPTAKRWLNALDAPEKRFVTIKNASHMVNFEKSGEWNRLLINLLAR